MRVYLILILCLACFYAYGQELHHIDKRLPCLNKMFSIHAHVVLDENGEAGVTAEQIERALTSANQFFEPICASFELCALDTIRNYNYDSIDVGGVLFNEIVTKYHVDNRINVYLVKSITDACGFAGSRQVTIDKDDCTSGQVFAHEFGHLFGLPHTFSGNNRSEFVDGTNCETAGDRICDTPADPFIDGEELSDYINGDCEFILTDRDPNGEFYQPHVGNIMSYYSGCRCGFTFDQYIRMVNRYSNSNPKFW